MSARPCRAVYDGRMASLNRLGTPLLLWMRAIISNLMSASGCNKAHRVRPCRRGGRGLSLLALDTGRATTAGGCHGYCILQKAARRRSPDTGIGVGPGGTLAVRLASVAAEIGFSR